MYHIVYKTTNLINGKEYIGKHSTNDLNDNYCGSGREIRAAISKYGIENFAVEILSFHKSSDEALAEEARIVNEDYVNREDTYNERIGGDGGWDYVNTNGLNLHIKSIIVKDKTGKYFRVNSNDSRFLSGELVGIRRGAVLSNDQRNNISKQFSGKFNGKDINGKVEWIDVNDPRVKNGQIVHINKGTSYNMKLRICPHCGKEGKGGNMTRWHFNKCPDNPNNEKLEQLEQRKTRIYKKVICPYCGKKGAFNRMSAHHFDNCSQKV